MKAQHQTGLSEFKASLGNLVRPSQRVEPELGCSSVAEYLLRVCKGPNSVLSTTNEQRGDFKKGLEPSMEAHA